MIARGGTAIRGPAWPRIAGNWIFGREGRWVRNFLEPLQGGATSPPDRPDLRPRREGLTGGLPPPEPARLAPPVRR
eukprot:3894108-Alexandrium_andersonii.AAC.1